MTGLAWSKICFHGQLQVTGLAWNATGSTLAVAFGRYDHEDWCTHRAAVGTWNLDRRAVKEDKPDTVIDSACCVMCLEFHPENPAWLVGGNFNGEHIHSISDPVLFVGVHGEKMTTVYMLCVSDDDGEKMMTVFMFCV